MIDLPNEADPVALLRHQPGRRLLVASSDGRGFVVEEDEVIAQTRAGKQVLIPAEGAWAMVCVPAEGDSVAVIGENRKLLIFPLDQVPPMARGRGVMLQKYAGASLADVVVFDQAQGLSWKSGDRTRTERDLTPWRGDRGQVGRAPPNGFPRSNRFG
jgi:topoisomerase-4 subunit A